MDTNNMDVQSLAERLWIVSSDAPWTPKTNVIPLDELRQWMTSDDIEVMGFVDATIHESRFRIEPPLTTGEYIAWKKRYYGRCFRENPSGEWANSRYSAGWSLVRVFIQLWDDPGVSREHLLDLKKWLAELYVEGDDDVRTCIVTAALEHLFERQPIRKYFSDWNNNPLLKQAYADACLWDRKTPLSS